MLTTCIVASGNKGKEQTVQASKTFGGQRTRAPAHLGALGPFLDGEI